jgi:hypothetical protein
MIDPFCDMRMSDDTARQGEMKIIRRNEKIRKV